MKAKMNASKSPVMKTQVVGSYPVPGWLQALPSAPNLRDAMLTIIKKLLLFALTMHPTRKSGVVSISEYVAVSILFMELDEFPVIIEMMHQTNTC